MTTHKCKIGDTVMVRDDLVSGNCYGTNTFVCPMIHMRGKTVKITGLCVNGAYEIEGSFYIWTDEMFYDDTTELSEFDYVPMNDPKYL